MRRKSNVLVFVKHRVWKILKPYFIVVALIMLVYRAIGADYPLGELCAYRVPESFVLIGQNRVNIMGYFSFLINGKSLSPHLWFVESILLSYVLFFIAKSIFDINEQKTKLFIIYSVMLSIIGLMLIQMKDSIFPYITFTRHIPVMILGLFLALFEEKILSLKREQLFLLYFVLNVCLGLFYQITEGFSFNIIYVNYALLSIWLVNQIMRCYTLKEGCPIIFLSSLSYVIYLIHSTILTIEWWYFGFCSCLFVVFFSVLFAHVYRCICNKQ